jgi:mycothiol synthase
MHLVIRHASVPQDYPAIAMVLTAENPEWPTTAEDLAHSDAVRDPKFHWTVFVAEETSPGEKRIIGMASAGHDPLAHREDKFKINMRVHPDMQGLGAGARLYQKLLHHLGPFAPCELYTEVWAAHPRAVRFVTERGFVEAWRGLDYRLDVSDFDFTPYAGLEGQVRASGLEIKTYAELEIDPDRLVKLYRLDRALWQDVPYGETITDRSLEQFEREEVQAPEFIPEACFIAMHGDEFVGYSNLTQTGNYFDVEMTGVLPAYRGKGVATLLKLCDIRYAQAHGNRELWTVNDSINTAMLALNEKLGFQRQGATVRFVKRLEETM